MVYPSISKKFHPLIRHESFESVSEETWVDSNWQRHAQPTKEADWDFDSPYGFSLLNEIQSLTAKGREYRGFLAEASTSFEKVPCEVVGVSCFKSRLLQTSPMCVATLDFNNPPLEQKTLISGFQHPAECTSEALVACDRLMSAGFVISNQTTLLAGINDDPKTIMDLNHKLLMMRVRPYVLFSECSISKKAGLFVKQEKGIEILETLRGWTSGLAVSFHVSLAQEAGTALVPEYIKSYKDGTYIFRNYRNQEFSYRER
ncbi:MAG: hypothetical protein J0L82_09920 [Deltaproteobacteria bacterium]|jgi:hypothetical protein|nr:hypothetical protein [Deltaproteobacteria bacterium]